MSNTIAHIAVAAEILKKNHHLIYNAKAFYLGVVAPDAIGSKPNCTRQDKKRVHLREDISDLHWLEDTFMEQFNLRIKEFVNQNIKSKEIKRDQKDFNIGYLVHLLTDKWNHKTLRQSMLKYAIKNHIKESDKKFFYMMTNDLEALDQYLLDTNEDVKNIFQELCTSPVDYALKGYIEKENIEKSILWWNEKYLPTIQSKKLKYLSFEEIDLFVENTANKILNELVFLLTS